MNVRNEGITGYIAGGLGNQLFILGAAWEQARRLRVPLLLDRSHYGVSGTRGFELDTLDVPARVLGDKQSWRSLRLNSERVLPIPNRFGRVFLERNADAYDARINAVGAGTTLLGYFQSARYFPTVGADILAAINAQPESSEEVDALAAFRSRPAVTLHLRRGDYLAVSTDRQLIASVDYARRALRLLADLGTNLPVRVFSDSVELVKTELADVGLELEFVGPDAGLGIWATLKAMSLGEAMIMSNSSFSWWAAALMQDRRESDTVVVAPRPWNSGGTAKADLLDPGWLTLDARAF